MTSTVNDLRKALRKGVQDFNTSAYSVAVENADFVKPTNGAPWFRLLIEEGVPRAKTYGHDEYSGYLQLDVNTVLQSGEGPADTICQAAANFFRAGKKLTYSDTEVIVRSCARSKGREVDGWWRVSITVYWDSQVDRPA